MVTVLYLLFLGFLSVFSFVLIDPNITFFQHPVWVTFRDAVVYIGYYRRDITWVIFVAVVCLLFLFHWHFIRHARQMYPVRLALMVSILLIVSYPLLSHDLFNYMFDARIATFYHQNPYLHRALDFPADQWLRFMHWTHRTYPYGPTFLILSFIPSVLGLGKFLTTFLLFKIFFGFFYVLGVYALSKMKKEWAVMFATHPLVIVEGLVCSHNDLAAVSLILVGWLLLAKRKQVWGRVLLMVSAGIKYTTAPFLVLMRQDSKNKHSAIINIMVGLVQLGLLYYMATKMEIQPWYFLTLFVVLPLWPTLVGRSWIFAAGLLFSYYPYIRLGGWDKPEKVVLKHQIILVFFILNVVYLVVLYGRGFFSGIHKMKDRES